MQFKIPLFSNKFELEMPSDSKLHPKQLSILNQIESKVDEALMQEVIDKLHEFYVEGQKQFRDVLPAMIQMGAFTQEMYDLLKEESPNEENSSDFVDFLEEPNKIHLPEPELCGDGTFGLTCECKWDVEHGVGVWFENWKPVRVGFADVCYPF